MKVRVLFLLSIISMVAVGKTKKTVEVKNDYVLADIDPSSIYRLTTQLSRDKNTLDIMKDGEWLMVNAQGNHAGQKCFFEDAGDGYHYVKTIVTGKEKCLSAVQTGFKSSKVKMTSCSFKPRDYQLWKVVGGTNDYNQIYNKMLGDTKVLTLVADDRIRVADKQKKSKKPSPQLWKLMHVGRFEDKDTLTEWVEPPVQLPAEPELAAIVPVDEPQMPEQQGVEHYDYDQQPQNVVYDDPVWHDQVKQVVQEVMQAQQVQPYDAYGDNGALLQEDTPIAFQGQQVWHGIDYQDSSWWQQVQDLIDLDDDDDDDDDDGYWIVQARNTMQDSLD